MAPAWIWSLPPGSPRPNQPGNRLPRHLGIWGETYSGNQEKSRGGCEHSEGKVRDISQLWVTAEETCHSTWQAGNKADGHCLPQSLRGSLLPFSPAAQAHPCLSLCIPVRTTSSFPEAPRAALSLHLIPSQGGGQSVSPNFGSRTCGCRTRLRESVTLARKAQLRAGDLWRRETVGRRRSLVSVLGSQGKDLRQSHSEELWPFLLCDLGQVASPL